MSQGSGRWFILSATMLALVIVAVIVAKPQVAVGSASSPTTPENLANEAPLQQSGGAYYWSYSAKFVCGVQNPLQPGSIGEPPVKPGNYASEINIHNYNYKQFNIDKKLLVLVGSQQGPAGPLPFVIREPDVARPLAFIALPLGPDYATMDDCTAIWNMAPQTGLPLVPGQITIGYLVIVSSLDLDVDVVYTAEVPSSAQSSPTGISIDVERVTGKRVFIPAGILPP